VSRNPNRSWLGAQPTYPWIVVGLLWLCGFFNYADRQALTAVFPAIEREFKPSDRALGALASAFMLVYSLTSPLTGYAVDLLSRRLLIPAGLAFWSLICAATALPRSFFQLLVLRGAEGLGESFYFPASMSVLADFHGPRTRSRAMSIHQTSVYLGTAGGWYLGGLLGERFGWRSPFWVLGLSGTAYALVLAICLVEPLRGGADDEHNRARTGRPSGPDPSDCLTGSLVERIARIVNNRTAALLLVVFLAANFVATTFLAWLPAYVSRSFKLGLTDSAQTSVFWALASLPGAVCGGALADWARRRYRGGRIRVQSLGLGLAAPFVLLAGVTTSVPILVIALVGAGICKGMYDANIFASLYDVIRPSDRGTGAGLMNTIGWIGGSMAPIVVGLVSDRVGLGIPIASTAALYLVGGVLAFLAARLAEVRPIDLT
jgi:MFS family permease